MLSDYLAEKKLFAKGPEFWHVGFVSPEKHCSEFFSLGCSSFSRYYVCKQPSVFQAASFGDLLLNEKQRNLLFR